jgi:hypothetical protein
MGPDGKYYDAVWGEVRKDERGLKVGFTNDFIILTPEYVVSRALCNHKPLSEIPSCDEEDGDVDEEYLFIEGDELLEHRVNLLYVCNDQKVADGKLIEKLNKAKVRKRK